MLLPYNSFLEGIYRVGKTINVGNSAPEQTETVDLSTNAYKHKGILIAARSSTVDPVVQIKFVGSTDFITLTLTRTSTSTIRPYILPCRVSAVRVQNGPADTYPITVTLLN